MCSTDSRKQCQLPVSGKSCVHNYFVGKASGLPNLLDEVIKTNMMD